jgi:SPP1 gp7 family putative phage head morphogenesis protein
MSDYWQKRFQAVEEMNNKRAKGTVQAVTPAFDKAQAQIEKEINAWYARFAKNNQIDLQEAKKLLNTRELKEFRWDVQEYIKYGKQNALDQAWMKQLENASARFHISRLEALKIRTQNAAERAFGNELDQLDQMAARIYMDDYYHTAYEIQRGLGIGWDVSQIDQRKLDNIVSKPWTTDKMTFSDRIWKSKTQLVDSLHKELTQMCVLGKAPDQAIKNIANRMNVSKGQAGRLVMTEAAYFGSAAQKDCFNDLDVEQFEVVATLDSRTSPMCQEMDGKVFDMKDFQIGVTAPPFHVWCRSCTAPWFEDNDDGTRAARGADGKTYQVPASMKYEDWKNTFVDGGSKDGLKPATVKNIKEAKRDIVELNKSMKESLGEAYEYHRLHNDMTEASFSEIADSDIISADFGKLSEKTASVFSETLTDLMGQYDTPLQKIRMFTKDEARFRNNSFAFVSHTYSVDSAELAINPLKTKDYDKLVEKINALSNRGYCIKVAEEFADQYVVTHEFAHTLLDMQSQLNNKQNWVNANYKKIKSARKEIDAVYERYMEEVKQLTKEYKAAELDGLMNMTNESWNKAAEAKKKLNGVKLSEYSLTNSDEFLAEAFTNEKIGVSSNPYGKEVLAILDKYFKR